MKYTKNESGLVLAYQEAGPDYYRGMCGRIYESPSRRGYLSIEVLNFLWGQPWNEIALAYVHAMNPSKIRVTEGEETTDAVPQRVTVRVDGAGIIREISQEVQVGLPEGCRHGHDLWQALERQKAGR